MSSIGPGDAAADDDEEEEEEEDDDPGPTAACTTANSMLKDPFWPGFHEGNSANDSGLPSM